MPIRDGPPERVVVVVVAVVAMARAMITIVSPNAPALARFYQQVLGFAVKVDMGAYIEMESRGVRFAVCSNEIMRDATGDAGYMQPHGGHAFELAFPCDGPEDVDASFDKLIEAGARPVKPPADMPWGQRAAFFADPDGNIHELFADLPPAA